MGETIRFGTPVSNESGMNAFVAHWPVAFEPKWLHIDLAHRVVHLVQLSPIYAGEIALIDEQGIDWFMQQDGFDPYNVRRADLSM